MTCAKKLGASLAGLSAAIQSGSIIGTALFEEYCETCPKTGQIIDAGADEVIRKIDNKALCQVMCCCQNEGKQKCVQNTLDAADDILRSKGGRSRYKAEVPYYMLTDPPTPILSEDDPTKGSRKKSDMEKLDGYIGFSGGKGHLRIPDIVIVEKPNKPPIQSNIVRVVEMKFGRDKEYDKDTKTKLESQYLAYARIAGGDGKFDTMGDGSYAHKLEDKPNHDCSCGEDDDGKRLPVLVPAYAPEEEKAPEGSWLEVPFWGIATAALAIATVAAAVIPFDGPAGEIAAGAGTAAAGARFAGAWGRVFGAVRPAGAM